MRMVFIFVVSLFLIYAILVSIIYISQNKLLYYPIREITLTPIDIELPFEDILVRTKDNVNISAWYIPAMNERGVVLFCHGNAGNISHRLDSIRIFHDLSLSVLIFDYRGYGKSGGSPTEEGTYRDAESVWAYLVNIKHVRPEKIILFGRSLGSAIAAELALRRNAGALIIESGFTSVPNLSRKYFPFLPVRLISRYEYATINKVRKINIPKLFIHSPEDEIIPFDHGKSLYESASFQKEFLEIKGDHNQGFLLSGRAYIDGIDRFISKYF